MQLLRCRNSLQGWLTDYDLRQPGSPSHSTRCIRSTAARCLPPWSLTTHQRSTHLQLLPLQVNGVVFLPAGLRLCRHLVPQRCLLGVTGIPVCLGALLRAAKHRLHLSSSGGVQLHHGGRAACSLLCATGWGCLFGWLRRGRATSCAGMVQERIGWVELSSMRQNGVGLVQTRLALLGTLQAQTLLHALAPLGYAAFPAAQERQVGAPAGR